MATYDIAIIGGGPGGFSAAMSAVKQGANTVLIEKSNVGGVCLNSGCIPTKALIASTACLNMIAHSDVAFGVDARAEAINITRIVERKDAVVSTLLGGMRAQLKKSSVTFINGEARLRDAGVIEIINETDIEKIEAKKIIIATGTVPKELPFLPFDHDIVLSSTDLLSLRALPKNILIIGGGYIGCEFATICNGLGIAVTIVEALDRLVPTIEKDLGKRLELAFKKKGIRVITGDSIKTVEKVDPGIVCVSESGQNISAEKALVAIGRERRISDLGFERIGGVMKNGAVAVNNYLETSISGIYAVGDILDSLQLAHVATYEGPIAAYNAVCGNKKPVDYSVVPSCIYTHPEIATVGLSKEDAEQKGIACVVGRSLFFANGKAHCISETDGLVKIVADAGSGVILGGSIMGPGATELIAQVALAVSAQMTAEHMSGVIHAHPTLSESVQEAAEDVKSKIKK